MVLSCLSLTTTPWSVRFGIFEPSLRLGLGALLRRDGLHARDIAPHLAHARSILKLPGGALKAQIELLLLQTQHLGVKLVDSHRAKIARFGSHLRHPAMRSMKRVLIGSLAAAS